MVKGLTLFCLPTRIDILQHLPQKEPGFAIMEAVVAAGFAAVALSASLFILNKQIEIADRARGLALIQAAINEDMNAVRHLARKWNWTNNPAGTATPPPNMLLYTVLPECWAFDWSVPGKLERMAYTDFSKKYGVIPGELSVPSANNQLISKTVPGYQIRRVYSFPSVAPQTNNSTTFSEEKPYTLRVTYTVNRVKTGQNGSNTLSPFPYTQTADIQFYAQFSC
jgi:hypothetical protein